MFVVKQGVLAQLLCAAVGIAALGLPGLAAAQDYPAKGRTIRVVVAFPPGVGVDAQARAVTPKLAEILGVPVIVDNKPGAGTLMAANEVIKAPADGYTLFYSASSTMAQNPHTMLAATYDPFKDFTPISMGAKGPLVLVVSNTLGVNNVKELVAYAKAHPGQLSYGSFGTGTSSHIFGQIFAKQYGLEMTHVPYKGGSDLALDLLGGRIQLAFDAAPASISHAASGKAKLIGVASPQRNPFLPGVPTLNEQGVVGLDLTSWLGWFGPAKLPPDVVKKLQAALAQALPQKPVQDFYKQGAYVAESSTPEELAAAVREAYDRWGALVHQAGIVKQ
ncbi:MAG TPA: tripartite tricarboxylate transporter substrate binding protein [Ideonella sp.]|nr:tripartite tricarboxylate transporter substrate binding protein [Ideonella sp.]